MARTFPEFNGPERWELSEKGKAKWWVEIRPMAGRYLIENDQGRSWVEDWDEMVRRRSMCWDAHASRVAVIYPHGERNQEWVLTQLWKMVGRKTNVDAPLKRSDLKRKHGKLRFSDALVDEVLGELVLAEKISLLPGDRFLVRPGFEKRRK